MFKRDDYIQSKPDAVFPNWQGLARSMLLRKPFTETQGLRKILPDYSISRDLDPKILIGPNDKENFRKGKDWLDRYRVQGSFPVLREVGLAVINHDQSPKDDPNDGHVAYRGQAESIKTRLRSYSRSIAQHDLLKHDSAAEKKSDFVASVHKLNRSRPQPVSDIVDESDSASVCGVLLEDGTTCSITPIKGRKRCTEHKGQRLSRVSPEKHIPCDEETETICGVILPEMVPCRNKPVSRRKRCEDHKGMRTNAFFFLLNPTEREKAAKEIKSKPDISTGSKNQENSGLGLLCEAKTKNGLPCTRNASNGSRRCWQHKDETLDHHRSSGNVQPATVSQVSCGVKLYNGSVCEKAPLKGRKRCEEHKGMRITS